MLYRKLIFLWDRTGQGKDAFGHKSLLAGGRESVYLAAADIATFTNVLNGARARFLASVQDQGVPLQLGSSHLRIVGIKGLTGTKQSGKDFFMQCQASQ